MSRSRLFAVAAAVVVLVAVVAAVLAVSSRTVTGSASPPAPSSPSAGPVTNDAYPPLSEPLDGPAAAALLPLTLTRSGGFAGGSTVLEVDLYGHVTRTSRDGVVDEWNLSREALVDLVDRLEGADLASLAPSLGDPAPMPDMFVFELVTPAATLEWSSPRPEQLAPAMDVLMEQMNR